MARSIRFLRSSNHFKKILSGITFFLSLLVVYSCTGQKNDSLISNPEKEFRPEEPRKDTIQSYMLAHSDNGQKSISKGSVSNGSIENAKLFPFSGNNFIYFDTLSYISGRAFLNGKVRDAVLSSYHILDSLHPGRIFRIMECSNEKGGKISPHRTHQNGMSIDFMVPLIKNNLPYYELDGTGGKHYLLDFNDDGTYTMDTTVHIDFDLIAEHLLILNEQMLKEGLKISKVIFKMELKDELYASAHGKKLKDSNIYITRNLSALINGLHDDHYHVDFVPTK